MYIFWKKDNVKHLLEFLFNEKMTLGTNDSIDGPYIYIAKKQPFNINPVNIHLIKKIKINKKK